jgi:hypothetical protein
MEASEGADELEDLHAGEAAYLWGARAWGVSGIYRVDIERYVDWFVFEGV